MHLDSSPLILLDPTHIMLPNIAQKSDQVPFIFRKFKELSDALFQIKSYFANNDKQKTMTEEIDEFKIPNFPLSALVLGKDS
jgi:hypothetical protein